MTLSPVRTVFAAAVFLFCAIETVGATELRNFQPQDVKAWRKISDDRLTPDGQWLVYTLRPDPTIINSALDDAAPTGEVIVVVRGTRSQVERRYSMGTADSSLQFSSDSSRFAFVRAAADRKSCIVVTIATGESHEVQPAEDCVFAGEVGNRLLVKRPAGEGMQTFGLSVHDLAGKQTAEYAGIESYSLSSDGASLITAAAAGLTWRDLPSGKAVEISAPSGGTYSQWTWASGNRALAMLREVPGRDPQLGIIKRTGAHAVRLIVHQVKDWAHFPQEAKIQGAFVWRADASGVFFNFTRPQPQLSSSQNPGSVAIWHSRASQVPAQVAWDRKSSLFVPYLGIFWIASGRAVALTDGFLKDVAPHPRARYLMGFDSKAYGWKGSDDDKTQRRDYYRVDVRTGTRTELLRDLPVYWRGGLGVPKMSPDGQTVIWRDAAGDYLARNLATGKTVELTKHLPVRFFHPENDPANSRQLLDDDIGAWGVQGWVPDRHSVLISDWYDVWELSLDGQTARNITVDGRQRGVRYRLDALTVEPVDPVLPPMYPLMKREAMRLGELPLSSRQPWYFSMLDEDAVRSGLARLQVGESRSHALVWVEADTRYLNAANTWLVMRYSAFEAEEYYLLDANWRRIAQLTDSNPQRREFVWPPPPKLLTYITSHGEKRHAALFLPAGYQSGKKYPTITFVYQQRSSLIHNYNPFSIELYPWLWSGYAVLQPDIVPRAEEPGQAAVESVSAAIDAAVAAGVVDRDHIGVSGHSYGGYETYYLAARTSLFKAAAPYAGLTDLLSDVGTVYGDLYDGVVMGVHPQSARTGSTQSFITPGRENWKAFNENSPLYYLQDIKTPLLMAHGDKDRSVRFTHAETLFNNLRLAGNPDVVLLQYPGEDHDFGPEATSDYRARLLQFFNHFLKGEPAPAWWTNGQSYPAGTAPTS